MFFRPKDPFTRIYYDDYFYLQRSRKPDCADMTPGGLCARLLWYRFPHLGELLALRERCAYHRAVTAADCMGCLPPHVEHNLHHLKSQPDARCHTTCTTESSQACCLVKM